MCGVWTTSCYHIINTYSQYMCTNSATFGVPFSPMPVAVAVCGAKAVGMKCLAERAATINLYANQMSSLGITFALQFEANCFASGGLPRKMMCKIEKLSHNTNELMKIVLARHDTKTQKIVSRLQCHFHCNIVLMLLLVVRLLSHVFICASQYRATEYFEN